MRRSPRFSFLGTALLASALAGPAGAADVTRLLTAVAARTAFRTPAVASGTLTIRSDAGETRTRVRLAGRRRTLRIDAGEERAIVRNGKALLRRGEGAAHLTIDAALAGSNVRYTDLTPLAPRLLLNPQIVDDGLSGTVVAAAPMGASPYVLLVLTIDASDAAVTQVKYYEHAINNLVKRDARSEWTVVAGTHVPTRIETWSVVGSDASELAITWSPAPTLGRAPFTRAGLATPLSD